MQSECLLTNLRGPAVFQAIKRAENVFVAENVQFLLKVDDFFGGYGLLELVVRSRHGKKYSCGIMVGKLRRSHIPAQWYFNLRELAARAPEALVELSECIAHGITATCLLEVLVEHNKLVMRFWVGPQLFSLRLPVNHECARRIRHLIRVR